MEMQKPSTEGCSITKKDCCNDEQVIIDGQDELKLHFDQLSFEQQVFITSFVYTISNLFEGFKKINLHLKNHPPLVMQANLQA